MDIAGKNALVTGGSSGIGRETCIALAKEGTAHIHIVDVNVAGAEETASVCAKHGAASTVHPCNVGDLEALESVFDAAGAATGLDIVFNNAGMVTGADLFPETPNARIETLVAVNVSAVFVGTRCAVKWMEDTGGVIVNTGSTSALHTRFRDFLYSATKAAVVQFTGSCGQLFESHGIRVCAVMPGLVDTPILQTTGGDRLADWMEPIIRDNVALPPSAIAEGVVALINDEGNAGEYLVVQAEE